LFTAVADCCVVVVSAVEEDEEEVVEAVEVLDKLVVVDAVVDVVIIKSGTLRIQVQLITEWNI
jgi:hypothetical protein